MILIYVGCVPPGRDITRMNISGYRRTLMRGLQEATLNQHRTYFRRPCDFASSAA